MDKEIGGARLAAIHLGAHDLRCKAEELSRDALAESSHNRDMLRQLIQVLRAKADEMERQETPPVHGSVDS
jgi:hypothetical protein